MSTTTTRPAKTCERCASPITPSARDLRRASTWQARRFCSKSCASKRDPRPCSAEDCDNVVRRNGLCDMHDQRMKAYGRLDRLPRLTTTEKLYAGAVRNGDCIEFTGRLNRYGYGYIDEWRGNKRTARLTAHRAAVIVSGRILPPDKVVMHTCDNPPCINPDHLVIGTQRDNIHDAIRKGRMDPAAMVRKAHENRRKRA